jgi:N-acetylmuramoyl-L-alanine amidase
MQETEMKDIMATIIQKPIGRQCGFTNQLYKPTWFVVHFTGGTPNLQSLYNYWLSQCGKGSNSHYGIERTTNQYARAGDIWQFLPLSDGACANCCKEDGAAPFLPNVNLNTRTVSCEGINPDTGNNGDMPQTQFDAYVYLIKTVCQELNIPTNIYTEYWNGYENTHTWGNANGGIIMHRDIAPRNRRMCPGTPYYSGQMDKLIQAVRTGGTSPVFKPSSDYNGWIIRSWNRYVDELNRAMPENNKIPVPRRDTGIFNFWKDLLTNRNIALGAVTSEEIFWSSNDGIVQYFEGGQIWYKSSNEKTAITGGGPVK